VKVNLEDGSVLDAISYLYTYDISRARHVPGGRFTEISLADAVNLSRVRPQTA
jgi:hypothetical protein